MHNIQRFESYGEFRTDDVPEFLELVLNDLYRDAEGVLEKTVGSCISVRKAERSGAFNDFTDDARERKINEALREDRQALHMIIRTHLVRCEDARKNVLNRIKAISTPQPTDDTSTQLTQALEMREVRDILRQKNVQERKELIEKSIENGNGKFLKAVVGSPDNLLPPATLEFYQKKYAFREMPALRDLEQQVEERAEVVRRKSGELNSTQLQILASGGFETDPLSRTEHLTTFTARTGAESWAVEKQINQEKDKQRVEGSHLNFDRDDVGMNLQAGEGA